MITFRRFSFFLCLSIFAAACTSDNKSKPISDLAFESVSSAKDYADLVITALKTDRDKVIFDQFFDQSEVDAYQLNKTVKTYAQSIGSKRSTWDYLGAEESELTDNGYDYTWYDQRGRIAIQINILPVTNAAKDQYKLEKIEFRSRIDVLESEAFPGGEISDFKKLAKK